MASTTMTMPARNVMKKANLEVTVKLTGMRWMKARMAIGVALIRLAALAIGCPVTCHAQVGGSRVTGSK